MRFEDKTTDPRVTIVVTQRERVSVMPETLDNIYDSTDLPVELIYVTGGLTGKWRRWLQAEAQRRGFTHAEAGRHMTPAEARNFGAQRAKTEFVLFVENDVLVQKGALEALLACADETRSDVVAPLTCEGRPVHTIIHHVGPEMQDEAFIDGPEGQRDFKEVYVLQGNTQHEVADKLVRRRTQNCEFHCVLIRRSLFDRIGYFDPDIVSKEPLDFSWAVMRAGGDIWVEPKAVATFLIPSETDPVRLCDLPYFLLRWSPEWQRRSHDALKSKWGLSESGFIAKRRKLDRWRLIDHVVKPALQKVPVLGRRWGFVERGTKLIYPLLALGAAVMVRLYDRDRRNADMAGGSFAQG
jgi:hypothetical protein